MPTEEEYKYIESRLGSQVSREPAMNYEVCKDHDLPIYYMSKEVNDGKHWVVVKYKKRYYLAR